MADFAGWVMRKHRPLLPENRIGRANLTAAFPEKTPAEIEAILRGVWDNLGRVGAEFAHLDRLWDFDTGASRRTAVSTSTRADVERFCTLAEDGKPALIFAAHLANWELPAISARDLRARQRRALSAAQYRAHRSLDHQDARAPSWAS